MKQSELHEIILVNSLDEQVGTGEKMETHRKALLHRAFSVFIWNKKGEMLLQQRAAEKYHSAGLWTNACCSHPFPGEKTEDAALRRLQEELGFKTPVKKAFDFIYKADFDNGLTENEFDHVFIGYYEGPVEPNPAEVMAYRYMAMPDIEKDLQQNPEKYTAWFKIAFKRVADFLAQSPQ